MTERDAATVERCVKYLLTAVVVVIVLWFGKCVITDIASENEAANWPVSSEPVATREVVKPTPKPVKKLTPMELAHSYARDFGEAEMERMHGICRQVYDTELWHAKLEVPSGLLDRPDYQQSAHFADVKAYWEGVMGYSMTNDEVMRRRIVCMGLFADDIAIERRRGR